MAALLYGEDAPDPRSPVQAARIRTEATVAVVGSGSMALTAAPSGDLTGADVTVLTGAAEGQAFVIGSSDGVELTFRPEAGGSTGALQPGDRVAIDNSWHLALLYHHRYQVPDESMYGWDQFRDAAGEPVGPQRDVLTGPVVADVLRRGRLR